MLAMSAQRIAIIEDEHDIAEIISYNMEREGYEVRHVDHGTEGLNLIKEWKPDLVILDIMLPGMDGIEICRSIRQNDHIAHTSIIMLSAKDDEIDVVLGLRIGADDYITKPFSPRELMARVKAIFRRHRRRNDSNDTESIEHGPLKLNKTRHEVHLSGQRVELTSTEFNIVSCLASQPGRVFNRNDLLSYAMGDDAIVIDRTIDVHIRSIRKKFEDDRELIETVRGVGYRFKDLN